LQASKKTTTRRLAAWKNVDEEFAMMCNGRSTALVVSLALLFGAAGLARSGLASSGPQEGLPQASSQVASPSASSRNFKPGRNDVSWQHEGATLRGELFLPATYRAGDRLPIVVVAGAWTSVKEQMATQYALRLSESGLAALTFDFRGWGASDGIKLGARPELVRHFESPEHKQNDIVSAAAFAHSLDVSSGKVGGLGICASASYMTGAIASGAKLESFATIAGWLHDTASLNALYGEETMQARINASREARAKFEASGEVVTVPAQSETDRGAAMPFPPIYYGNPARGSIPQWENAFAVMSWEPWKAFDAIALAPKVQVPTLVVHGDNCALPANARAFFEKLAGPKELFWVQDGHLDLYDQPSSLTKAGSAVATHFALTLK
jgi:uncharacterized protein